MCVPPEQQRKHYNLLVKAATLLRHSALPDGIGRREQEAGEGSDDP